MHHFIQNLSTRLLAASAIFLAAYSSAYASGLFSGGKTKVYKEFSRLTIINQCYRDIHATIEDGQKYKPRSRLVYARRQEAFELWTGTTPPDMGYTMERKGVSPLKISLQTMLANAQPSTKNLGNIVLRNYTYTFCQDEPPLGTPRADFIYTAKKGEALDGFRMYITQIPGSKELRFAYKNYPVSFFLDEHRFIPYLLSDDKGYLRFYVPKGTPGGVRLSGTAFDGEKARMLYKEWLPEKSIIAKGGETVYCVPPHKNTTGW